MNQEPSKPAIAMPTGLVAVASRFNAWGTIHGSGAETDSARSWKLVYGEALDSIHRLHREVEMPVTYPVDPSPVLQSRAVPSLPAPSLVPLLVPRLQAAKSVTETASLSKPGPVPFEIPVPARTATASQGHGSNGSDAVLDAAFSRRSSQPEGEPQDEFSAASFDVSVSSSVPSARATDPPPSVLRRAARGSSRCSDEAVSRARDTSLTVRLTSSEAALLRRKAAEGGFTVSAYLRQCALDASRIGNNAHQPRAQMEMPRPSLYNEATQTETSQTGPSQTKAAEQSGAQRFAARALRLLGVDTFPALGPS